ncbi:hypothetical protein BD408DRAFT_409665 [Parasitella parasitica]|nr:hypothetical protein BD408DRAFT_409665 [Parasitella parasitica]
MKNVYLNDICIKVFNERRHEINFKHTHTHSLSLSLFIFSVHIIYTWTAKFQTFYFAAMLYEIYITLNLIFSYYICGV